MNLSLGPKGERGERGEQGDTSELGISATSSQTVSSSGRESK